MDHPRHHVLPLREVEQWGCPGKRMPAASAMVLTVISASAVEAARVGDEYRRGRGEMNCHSKEAITLGQKMFQSALTGGRASSWAVSCDELRRRGRSPALVVDPPITLVDCIFAEKYGR